MGRFQRTLADGRVGCFIRLWLCFNQLVTMGNNGRKYRYAGLVVEVLRIKDVPNGGRFQCLVRGDGKNNRKPRETYIMDKETPAIASRNAVQMYIDKYGQEIK